VPNSGFFCTNDPIHKIHFHTGAVALGLAAADVFMKAAPDWRAEANDRIDQHRKAEATVTSRRS